MTTPDIPTAAETTANIARDMARTLDNAAQQIVRASSPLDVATMGDLLNQVARIQQVIQQANSELAPERITRAVADLT